MMPGPFCFEAPKKGIAFFGVLLDSTYSANTAGVAQREARETDALCFPVCTSSNFVERSRYPLSYDSSETGSSADCEEEAERMHHTNLF